MEKVGAGEGPRAQVVLRSHEGHAWYVTKGIETQAAHVLVFLPGSLVFLPCHA